MKICSRCKLPKDNSEFCKDKSRSDGLNHRCNMCNKIHVQEIAKKQKKQFGKVGYRRMRRKYELAHYYGITEDEFQIMVDKQNNVCAICKQNPEQYLAIDHCHDTGKIRGLLCRKCNSAIGLFNEDVDRLTSALEYIRKKKINSTSGIK